MAARSTRKTPAQTGQTKPATATRTSTATNRKATPAPAKAAPAPAPAPATPEPKTFDYQYVLVNGQNRVHKAGCKDIEAELKNSDYDSAPADTAVSREQIIRDYADDRLSDHGLTGETATLQQLYDLGYIGETEFAPCMRALPKLDLSGLVIPAKPGKAEAKRELAKGAVAALDAYLAALPEDGVVLSVYTQAEAARIISQMIHHFPTGGEWPATVMPIPDRSNWAKPDAA